MLTSPRTPKSPFYRTLQSCLMACVAPITVSTLSLSLSESFQVLPDEENRPARPWLELLDIIRRTVPNPRTPRPTVDVDLAEVSSDRIRKEHPLLDSSFWSDTVLDSFRQLQLQRILKMNRCSHKEALEMAEDPDPYAKDYIFYCLAPIRSRGSSRYPY